MYVSTRRHGHAGSIIPNQKYENIEGPYVRKNTESSEKMIIAAFAGVGKTYFCNHVERAKDFVCMPYKYILPKGKLDVGEEEARKSDWSLALNLEYPRNFVEGILENRNRYDYLVIPSDSRVLEGLKGKNVSYLLCYPEAGAKEEYRKRYLQRGNTEDFIDIFIGNWEGFMESLRRDTYGTHIILSEKEYLLDVKGKMDEIISRLRKAGCHENEK
jgi:ferredoxin-thioredoxin reductase catalytic subunit